MARITVEDCIDKVEGPYDLVLIAKERAVQLNSGEKPNVDPENDKNTVIALKEIAENKVSVKELKDNVLFLRKLVEGGSEHSFGIHVAQMAGMPSSIVKRANNIMQQLESSHSAETLSKKAKNISKKDDIQLSFFQLDDPTLIQIREEIMGIDINTLTPVEALLKLSEIKKHIGKK